MRRITRRAAWWLGVVLALAALSWPASRMARSLMMTRRAVSTFWRVLLAANSQDLEGLRAICTGRYLEGHPLERSPGGGVVGFPRGIHKNFRVWREGDEVWLCPSGRDVRGPVYRFVFEGGPCRFDGLVGLLEAGGRVERPDEASGDFF